MNRADQKIVVVTRKTRLQELVQRFNTRGQAKFYVSRMREVEGLRAPPRAVMAKAKVAGRAEKPAARDGDFADYEIEDQTYRNALGELQKQLGGFDLPVQVIDRSFVPTFLFGKSDVVVTLGQDGLVANVAKYALEQPIVAVNPDPGRFDGVLLPFAVSKAAAAVHAAVQNRARLRSVTLAEVTLNDGQHLLAFNDFFIGSRTHVSARYRIELDGRSEPHSSSGVLVSTGAGSTGWLSSVFNMAASVAGAFAPAGVPESVKAPPMPWEDPRLVFVVREPFVSRSSRAAIAAGVLEPGRRLILESMMPQHGVIFSDGVEADALEFNAGATAHVNASPRHARLVMP